MKARLSGVLFVSIFILYSAVSARAQELGPGFHKIKDGIYTFAPDQGTTTVQLRGHGGGCRDDR